MRYVFPDTNIFLHYTYFTELDWCGLVGQRDVTVVVCQPVLAELDLKKTDGRSPRQKERARKVVRDLDAITECAPGAHPLRDGVALILTPEPPPLPPSFPGSSHVDQDGRILAAIGAFRSAPEKADVVLVSGDLGIKVRARAAEVPVIKPPDGMLLPDEPDPLEAENRKLKAKVQRFENRFPKLSVRFADGDSKMTVALKPALPIAPGEMVRDLAALRAEHPVPPEHSELPAAFRGIGYLAGLTAGAGAFAAEPLSHEECKQRLESYLRQSEKWLRAVYERDLFLSLTVEIALQLSNSGTAPAGDIDVYVTSPESVRLALGLSPPEVPDEPDPPNYLTRGSGRIPTAGDSNILMRDLLGTPFVGPMTPRQLGPNRVKIPTSRLKHGESMGLPSVHATFRDARSIGNFELVVEVTTASLPEKPTFRLPILARVEV
jgi:hypothetical protein